MNSVAIRKRLGGNLSCFSSVCFVFARVARWHNCHAAQLHTPFLLNVLWPTARHVLFNCGLPATLHVLFITIVNNILKAFYCRVVPCIHQLNSSLSSQIVALIITDNSCDFAKWCICDVQVTYMFYGCIIIWVGGTLGHGIEWLIVVILLLMW